MNSMSQSHPVVPPYRERRAAMYLAQRYLNAANRASFAAKHGMTPDSLAMRYAQVLPDLLERHTMETAESEANVLIFGLSDWDA